MRHLSSARLVFLLCLTVSAASPALDSNEALKLKLEVLDLVVDSLVDEGVIPQERADEIRLKAADRAQQEAAADEPSIEDAAAEAASVPAAPGGSATVDAATSENQLVIYVPEFIKDELKADVREEVTADLVDEVLVGAQEAEWGIPDALPAWLKAIDWYGDLRLRQQVEVLSQRNQPLSYPNWNAINAAGGVTAAGADAFLNTTENRQNPSARARIGFRANFREDISMGLRIATQRGINPVNQEILLSGYTNNFDVSLDRAYVQYQARDVYDFPWLRLTGGLMANPYLHTDLVWDPDLAFQGVAIDLLHNFGGGISIYDDSATSTTFGLTVGAYALDLDEIAIDDDDSNDKWLVGLQALFRHRAANRNLYQLGFAIYDYSNVVGQFNTAALTDPNDRSLDWTAPDFLQTGNTIVSIRNPGGGAPALFGLASDFSLFNVTARADVYNYAAARIGLFADFVWNIAYDEDEVFSRAVLAGAAPPGGIPARNIGYQAGIEIGEPSIGSFKDWMLYASYKVLQRDAVIDAFTHNDFRLGGTDAKGFILGAQYGLSDYAWLEAKWLQGEEIDGAPYGVQVFQFDLNSRF